MNGIELEKIWVRCAILPLYKIYELCYSLVQLKQYCIAVVPGALTCFLFMYREWIRVLFYLLERKKVEKWKRKMWQK